MSGQSSLANEIVELLPRLRMFALSLTRADHDADDLVQATAERAFLNLHRWRAGTRLDAWLFRMMRNLWIDEVRQRRRRGRHEAEPVDNDFLAGIDGRGIVEFRGDLRDTMNAMMALPEEQRLVVSLVIFDGMSYREAAEVLETRIGTIMSRLARARASLERALSVDPIERPD